jgi:hypothetical protein
MRLLRDCAERYGRSVAEELRLAVELHVTTSAVHELARPEVRHRLSRDADTTDAELREHLRALAERAYGRWPRNLLESLLGFNERMKASS